MTARFNLYPQTIYGDRAFNYGDGCFTTMLCIGAHIQLFSYHLARLEHDTQKLRIPFTDEDKERLSTSLANIATELVTGVIKVHISRGSGGRGYGSAGVSSPIISLTQHTVPGHFTNPVSLTVAAVPISRQSTLAGTKHTSRLEQVLFKQSADEAGTTDVICLDEYNHVIETSSANLFWCKDEQWFTPELSHSGVAGTYRACILDTLASMNTPCQISSFPLTALLEAESVLMCNAVRGIVAVDKVIIGEKVTNVDTSANASFIEFSNTSIPSLQKQVDLFLAT